MGFNWTTTAVETLKSMFADNQPARIVADEFGITRNAVIGKAHRLGLSHPKLPARPRVAKALKLKINPVLIRLVPKPKAPQCEPEPNARNLTVLELEPGDCKWPVTPDHEFKFCGHPSEEGKPYCAHHQGRARL
jgi:GcrA cell cycle regulator